MTLGTTKIPYVFDDLTPKGPCVVSHPISYSFRFKTGWAIFTLNDSTGEFSVQSDWGDYAYRWHTGSLGGSTLTEFVRDHADCQHIADKFSYGGKANLADVFDEEATKANVVRVVRECMRDLPLDERRQLGLDLRETLRFGDAEEFMRSIDECEVANKFLDHENICTKKSYRFEFLKLRLLPFFKTHLKSLANEGKQ